MFTVECKYCMSLLTRCESSRPDIYVSHITANETGAEAAVGSGSHDEVS